MLAGKVGVVTGGAQGIGSEIAAALARAGASVVVADTNFDLASEVATAIGDSAHAIRVDVADEGSVEAMFAETSERFGRVDVLVNNAAIFSSIEMKPFDEISPAEWSQVILVNLTGAFLCCRAAAPYMREQLSGSIVNISSATVLSGRPYYLHYVTSKAGIVGMTRGLARELGVNNVNVNAIMPGSVDTGIPRGTVTPEQTQAIVDAQSLSRRLTSPDIAAVVAFLASDAAKAITGQTIVVDGGMNFV